jgi:hypothetical protein
LFKLPVDDKGYLLYSHCFIDDGHNNFIVPTNKGLFRLNRDNLLQISTAPSTPLLYEYFDMNDDYQPMSSMAAANLLLTVYTNGDIILPALQGLVELR